MQIPQIVIRCPNCGGLYTTVIRRETASTDVEMEYDHEREIFVPVPDGKRAPMMTKRWLCEGCMVTIENPTTHFVRVGIVDSEDT